MVADKMAVIQVIGSLIKKPALLLEDTYVLKIMDFPERFHQIIFSAIYNLINTGIKELDVITLDNYISQYEKQYVVFNSNNGVQYLEDCIDLANVKNFKYYYNRLRKFALLKTLNKNGFDIKELYDDSLIDVKIQEEMQRQFDEMTLEDIIVHYESKIIDIKTDFCETEGQVGQQAGKGMKDLKERFKKTPEMGVPMHSGILTTIVRGARLKTFYLRSLPSGFGKSRLSVSDICKIAVPYYYDTKINEWVKSTISEPSLFVSTELEIDEIQSLMMAYISGVDESHILDGKYNKGEEERVDQAAKYIEESPLYIEYMPDFNINDISNAIKKYKLKFGIGYVFFDYLHTSVKLLMEIGTQTRGVKLREDNILFLFSSEMKKLANKLNIHILSGTQLNGDWETTKNGTQNLLRGAKSISDRIDFGCIGLPVTEVDLKALNSILSKNFNQKIPNLVYHIYKVRRGKFVRVKLWMYADLGTCRTEDLFLTDNDYRVIEIESTDVEKILEDNIDNEPIDVVEDVEDKSGFKFEW